MQLEEKEIKKLMNFHFIERIMQNYPRKVITFKTFSPLCIQCHFEKVDLIVSKL